MVTLLFILSFSGGASLLGILIAYQSAKSQNKTNEEDKEVSTPKLRDRSGGKKVGKEVNLFQRKITKVISEDNPSLEEETGRNEAYNEKDFKEMLEMELK